MQQKTGSTHLQGQEQTDFSTLHGSRQILDVDRVELVLSSCLQVGWNHCRAEQQFFFLSTLLFVQRFPKA